MRATMTLVYGEEGIYYSSVLKEEWLKPKVPDELC